MGKIVISSLMLLSMICVWRDKSYKSPRDKAIARPIIKTDT